jgi:tRNA nucleotidyltransferase (CCA-adding enzyme)
VRKDVTWGQVYELLENLSLEVLLYLIARTRIRSVKQKIALYLTGLRFRKPVVTGRDLSSWGYPSSPFFRKALRRLFIAQLDGCISNVDEARRFLEEHIVRNGEGD